MLRWLVALCAAVLAACGGSGSSGSSTVVSTPPSARSIAENSFDFPDLARCPESGTYDSYLTQEQAKAPDQYTTDSKDWTVLKASGANDGYIVVYVASTSADCGQYGASAATGKVAYIYAIRFKDSAKASAAYKNQLSQFHMSDADITNLKTAGGTAQQGAATGLGDNSIVVSIDIQGTTFYIALWQNKEFEVALLVYNLSLTSGKSAATKINGRIR